MAIEAYCVKCKAKKEMQNPVEGVTKNGKPIMKGTCPDCGGKICRIGAVKYPERAQLARGDVSRETSPFLVLIGVDERIVPHDVFEH